MADAESEKTAPAQGAGGGKKRFLAVAGGAIAVVAIAVVVGVMGFPDESAHHVTEAKPVTKPTLIGLPQVVVNLANSKGLRLLQCTTTIEVTAADIPAAESSFARTLPRVQDLMIRQLSMLTAEELEGAASKDLIKQRITDELNQRLFATEEFKVTNLFFTEFVLQ